MAQNLMTEKDMFLQTFQRECATTLKLLKAYPAAKQDLRPAEKSRSAKELAWVFTLEQGMSAAALSGSVDFSKPMPPPPAGFNDTITAFENASKDTLSKVSKASDETLQRPIKWPVGPGKMQDFRCLDVLWFALMDQVHHRGQLSVYLRLAGAKVPSIYGPTADETWM
jgi:uncharacterized damage-inducible protein DinB